MKKLLIKLLSIIYFMSVFSVPIMAEDNKSEVELNMIKTEVKEQSNGNYIQTSKYEIVIPAKNNTSRTSSTTKDNDSTISMEATLTSIYTLNKTNNTIILTGVSGSWRPLDSRAYIKKAQLIYGCSAINFISQTGTKNPASSPFSYSTGFMKYVGNDIGSDVGARLNLTLGRGSTWSFEIQSKVVSSNLSLF